MGKRATWALLFAAGLMAGLTFSGVFHAPEQVILAADRAVEKPHNKELEELRDFAGKFERLFQTVAEQVSPAVVLVEVEKKVTVTSRGMPFGSPFDDLFRSPFDDLFRSPFGDTDPFRGRQPRQQERTQRGLGSGVLLDKEGHILTNNHVVADVDKVTVKLADDRSFEAKVVGTDDKTDLAVIQIKDPPENLPVAVLGDSEELRIGQWVLAIGNPMGLSHTVSAGIVSAKGRSGLGVARYESMIQTDAAINRGNSGGPLVNLRGEVVGINAAIFSPTGGSVGIGFAIPINMAKDILDDLLEGRKVVRGHLGVIISDVTPGMAEMFDFEGSGGALVNDVQPDTPAAEAGIQPGDIITEYDGHAIDDRNDLSRRVAASDPGERVKVKVWRDGKERTVTVKVGNLEEADADQARDWLGMTVRPLTKEEAKRLGRADLTGVVVSDVERDSIAAGKGIREGDVILSVNRRPVSSPDDYVKAVNEAQKHERVLLRVLLSRTGYIVYMRLP